MHHHQRNKWPSKYLEGRAADVSPIFLKWPASPAIRASFASHGLEAIAALSKWHEALVAGEFCWAFQAKALLEAIRRLRGA